VGLRLRRSGAFALKPVSSPAQARRLVSLTGYLRAWKLRTPSVAFDAERRVLVFPWIEGLTGWERLARDGRLDPAAGPFVRMIAVLATLHRIPPPGGVGLDRLDPWRRITPRLQRGSFPQTLRRNVWETAAALAAALDDLPLEPVLVHGDYHVGQLLFDAEGDIPWLLDLEDVGLGPAEFDLGNFVAHLATSLPDWRDSPLRGFRRLCRHVVPCYAKLAGRVPSSRGIALYGAAALLRRGLKLWENGSATSRQVGRIVNAARELGEGHWSVPLIPFG